MTVEKIIPNINIKEISQLKVGDGFITTTITSNVDIENFYIVIGKNTVENFSRCVNLSDGLEYVIRFGAIVRKIDKLIVE